MKKYMTRGWTWSPKIEVVEVERETDLCVWINGRRNAKKSEYANYFDTWVEAHALLSQKAEDEVDAARATLERLEGYQGNINGMKPPSVE